MTKDYTRSKYNDPKYDYVDREGLDWARLPMIPGEPPRGTPEHNVWLVDNEDEYNALCMSFVFDPPPGAQVIPDDEMEAWEEFCDNDPGIEE